MIAGEREEIVEARRMGEARRRASNERDGE
jgi:hypothetical protein